MRIKHCRLPFKTLVKAYTIANTLGVTLGAIPSQVQEPSRTAGPMPYMTAKFAASAVENPIEPGQLTIRAAVRVWFYLLKSFCRFVMNMNFKTSDVFFNSFSTFVAISCAF